MTDPDRLAPDERARLQSERLARQVQRLATCGSAYWKEKLAGTGPVTGLGDLAALPFTDKDEFRQTYPLGMVTVPREQIARVHASSGTSGRPTVVAYTAADVALFAEVVARSLACAGASAADVVHIAYGYGLFTGGLGLHYGVERLGAAAVPASGGNVPLQLAMLSDLGADGLACTPSFALLLAERAAQAGVQGLRVRYAVCGAEPWSEPMRAKLEASWSALTGGPFDACDIYGLSEVIGPGVAMECREGKGALHVFDDHFLPEVVDPWTDEPKAPGEPGELVLTTLTKQAQPVLRYRTRDVTRLVTEPCPCGRTTARIGRFEGRVDDMLVIRGVNVFPSQIEWLLLADEALGPQYALVVDRRRAMPELRVLVELATPGGEDQRAAVTARLAHQLASTLRLRTEVVVHDPGTLPRQEVGKARRVFEQVDDRDPVLGS